MSCSKLTIENIPSNRKCQRILHRIVYNTEACPVCGHALKYTDAYAWCGMCRKKIRVRSNTWLKNSKLSFRTLFILILAWQQRCTPGDIATLVGVSYPTIQLWFMRFRFHLPRDAEPLKGYVEIDESFFGKRKHNHQIIVLGARERKGRLKLQPIPNREEGILESWILENIDRASMLYTDLWRGYQNIGWYGYGHEPENHSMGQLKNTTTAENIWSVAKRQLQKQYGRFILKHLYTLIPEWGARRNFPHLFTSPQMYLQECLFRFL